MVQWRITLETPTICLRLQTPSPARHTLFVELGARLTSLRGVALLRSVDARLLVNGGFPFPIFDFRIYFCTFFSLQPRLMLIAMTYNVWLTAAVVLGAGFGHWLFAGMKCVVGNSNNANDKGGVASATCSPPSPMNNAASAENFASDACH